jgi:hypothetical protein
MFSNIFQKEDDIICINNFLGWNMYHGSFDKIEGPLSLEGRQTKPEQLEPFLNDGEGHV